MFAKVILCLLGHIRFNEIETNVFHTDCMVLDLTSIENPRCAMCSYDSRAYELRNLVIKVVTEQNTPEAEDAGQERGGQEDVSSLPRTADYGVGNVSVGAEKTDIQLILFSHHSFNKNNTSACTSVWGAERRD